VSARPSDSLRLERAKLIRVADIAELIVASGQMPAHKGRTYDCTVPRSSVLTKRLANRAVPHMSQSQTSTPIDNTHRPNAKSCAQRSKMRMPRSAYSTRRRSPHIMQPSAGSPPIARSISSRRKSRKPQSSRLTHSLKRLPAISPELSPIFGDGLKDQAAAVWG